MLTVGAVDRQLEPWVNSHRSEYVDVAAPGTDIPALVPSGEVQTAPGTSNSSALVSGVVALVRAVYPEASAYEVVARILATVQDLGDPGRDDATGYGMVRPYEALTEPVPDDASNPVFDNAGDLTDVAEPPPEPTAFAPQEPPAFGAPPTTQDDGPVISAVVVLTAIGGLVLLGAAVVVTVLLIRSRRRPPPYPYP